MITEMQETELNYRDIINYIITMKPYLHTVHTIIWRYPKHFGYIKSDLVHPKKFYTN